MDMSTLENQLWDTVRMFAGPPAHQLKLIDSYRSLAEFVDNASKHEGNIKERHSYKREMRSFDLSKNDCAILDKYLKFTSLKSVSLNNGLRNSNCINSRRLFYEFSFNQRSYLRNSYIRRFIHLLRRKSRRRFSHMSWKDKFLNKVVQGDSQVLTRALRAKHAKSAEATTQERLDNRRRRNTTKTILTGED